MASKESTDFQLFGKKDQSTSSLSSQGELHMDIEQESVQEKKKIKKSNEIKKMEDEPKDFEDPEERRKHERASIIITMGNIQLKLADLMYNKYVNVQDPKLRAQRIEGRHHIALNIPLSIALNKLAQSIFIVLRQTMNEGRDPPMWNKMGETTEIRLLGTTYELNNLEVRNIIESTWKRRGFNFVKVNNESPKWIGIASPYYDYFGAFGYRLNELRLGHMKFATAVRRNGFPVMKSISDFGLSPVHQILCSGITFPPERMGSMPQSLGPMTILIFLNLVSGRYQDKWKTAANRAIRHIPHCEEIVRIIAEQNMSASLRKLMSCVAKLILLTTSRSIHRMAFPPCVLSAYFAEGQKNYYKMAHRLSFSGPGGVFLYKVFSARQWIMGGKDINQTRARQMVYHAIFDTFQEDLSVLERITDNAVFIRRNEYGDSFKELNGDQAILFTPVKQNYYTRLAASNQSEFLTGSKQQNAMQPIMGGERRHLMSADLLRHVTEEGGNRQGLNDIDAICTELEMECQRITRLIQAKGRIVKIGHMKWKSVEGLTIEPEQNGPEVPGLVIESSGKYFLDVNDNDLI